MSTGQGWLSPPQFGYLDQGLNPEHTGLPTGESHAKFQGIFSDNNYHHYHYQHGQNNIFFLIFSELSDLLQLELIFLPLHTMFFSLLLKYQP